MTAHGVAPVANILHHIFAHLVDYPDAVRILSTKSENATTFTISCDPRDLGKLIGKQGRMARALRTVLSGMGMAQGHRYSLNIEDHRPAQDSSGSAHAKAPP